MTDRPTYVVCIDNSPYPASLEVRKIYQQLPDPRAEADGLTRVIDESNDDYLYPSRLFAPIDLPRALEEAFADAR